MTHYYTPSDIAKPYDVHVATVRRWCQVYAEYLSGTANPPKGEPRRFTADDAAVLALVAKMRADNRMDDAIRAALNAGERVPFAVATEADEAMEAGAAAVELARLRAENEKLRTDLEREREQRIAAQIEAAEHRGQYKATAATLQNLLTSGVIRGASDPQTIDVEPEPPPAGERADDAAAELERLRRERDDAERRAKEATRRAEEAERPAPRFGRLFDRFRRE